MKGLEPPRLTAPDPKSGVATNYTTSAFCKEPLSFFVSANIYFFYIIEQIFEKIFLKYLISKFLFQIHFLYFYTLENRLWNYKEL